MVGTDPYYNIFELEASLLGSTTISIDVPSTSIVLVNLIADRVEGGLDVTISHTNHGVILNDDFSPQRLLWNVPTAVNFISSTTARPGPYSFKGTMLNRLGSFYFDARGQPAEFQGQLFADTVGVSGMDFVCGGHFVGFTSKSCGNSGSTNSVRRNDEFGF